MPKRAPLAKSELEIARIVWKLGDATVRQVADGLFAKRRLDYWTVRIPIEIRLYDPSPKRKF